MSDSEINNDSKKKISSETVNAIKKYIEIDDNIKKLKEEIKKYSTEKQVAEIKILEYLNSAGETIINTNDSKLKKNVSKIKGSLKEKNITEIINKCISDQTAASILLQKITETIQVKEKIFLTRSKT